jgi:tetratricopeptide (TPR) repeat protein
LRADALIGKRDYYKAHVSLQGFLNQFAGTEYEDEALEKEFVIAEVFIGGTKRKFLGMRILDATDIGLAILDDISANYPGTTIAELATLTKAEYYYGSGDFAFAEQEYAFLVQNFPRSRYVRPAMLQAAHSAMASFPGIPFDDASLIEAEERFNRYVAQYPGAAEQEGIGLILVAIGEKRAAKELHIGRYYERTGQPRAARFYYRSTIDNWPETIAAVEAEERLMVLGGSIEREGPVPAEDSAPAEDAVSLKGHTGEKIEAGGNEEAVAGGR